jgi:hypothetical protein
MSLQFSVYNGMPPIIKIFNIIIKGMSEYTINCDIAPSSIITNPWSLKQKSLQNIKNSLYTDTADHSNGFHCIQLPWKLGISYKIRHSLGSQFSFSAALVIF